MAEDLLRTNLYRYGSTRTLFVTGELDVATGPVFEGAVAGALDGQDGELALDLSALQFMDSTGAKSLMCAHDKAVSLGTRLVILSPTRPVRRVLELMGLDRVIDVKDGATPPRKRFR